MKSKEPLGSTPLDDEDRTGLLQKHITTREELNAAEFANINQAYLKYFAGRLTPKKAPFTFEWLKRLHAEMFGDVWEWAGTVRVKEISPGIPVHQITTELAQFSEDLKAWEEFKHDAVEISAKIHHRLVWIHPFRNGNGRWARVAANVYLKLNRLPLVKWPENEMFVSGTFRREYIAALQNADRGDFEKLIALHKRLTVEQDKKSRTV